MRPRGRAWSATPAVCRDVPPRTVRNSSRADAAGSHAGRDREAAAREPAWTVPATGAPAGIAHSAAGVDPVAVRRVQACAAIGEEPVAVRGCARRVLRASPGGSRVDRGATRAGSPGRRPARARSAGWVATTRIAAGPTGAGGSPAGARGSPTRRVCSSRSGRSSRGRVFPVAARVQRRGAHVVARATRERAECDCTSGCAKHHSVHHRIGLHVESDVGIPTEF